jgi:hypothetical protein|tara:strand:- start:310 stop:483 length:174 start_codon:yes stop_codon:yes gene_type:complete
MSFDDQPLASLHAWMQARNAAGSQPEAVQEEEKSEPKKPQPRRARRRTKRTPPKSAQ